MSDQRPSGTATTIDQHLTILGALHLAYGLLVILLSSLAIGGMVTFTLFASAALPRGEPVPPIAAMVVGSGIVIVALIAALFGPLGIIGGIGLLKRRAWARTLTLVQGVLILVGVPLGTALGIYTIWVLTRSDAPRSLAADQHHAAQA